VKLIETRLENSGGNLKPVQTAFKDRLNGVQKYFKNNCEKYEYLIQNDPNNFWIAEFKQTKEYELIYGSGT